MGLYTEYRT